MRTTLLAAIVLSLTSPALAQVTTGLPDFSQEDDLDPRIEVLYKNEASGIQQYERGEHDKAFELLSETAVQGLKDSQYVMAFMFLKGEHVDKSILLGMAWLGVAKESGNKDWVELYDGMYARANAAQQSMIDAKVDQYVEQYGMSATNITCKRTQVTGSRRYQMRCIKVGGYDTDPIPVELHP